MTDAQMIPSNRGVRDEVPQPRSTYTPLTEYELEALRVAIRTGEPIGVRRAILLCDMASSSLLYAEEIDRLRSAPLSETAPSQQGQREAIPMKELETLLATARELCEYGDGDWDRRDRLRKAGKAFDAALRALAASPAPVAQRPTLADVQKRIDEGDILGARAVFNAGIRFQTVAPVSAIERTYIVGLQRAWAIVNGRKAGRDASDEIWRELTKIEHIIEQEEQYASTDGGRKV